MTPSAAGTDTSRWFDRVARPGAVKKTTKSVAVPAKPEKAKKAVPARSPA